MVRSVFEFGLKLIFVVSKGEVVVYVCVEFLRGFVGVIFELYVGIKMVYNMNLVKWCCCFEVEFVGIGYGYYWVGCFDVVGNIEVVEFIGNGYERVVECGVVVEVDGCGVIVGCVVEYYLVIF